MGRRPFLPMEISPHPMPYKSNLTVIKKFRFYNQSTTISAGGTYFTITAPKLGGLVVMATTTTNVVQFFEQVRVIKVEIWSSINNSNNVAVTPTTVGVNFSGTTQGVAGPDMNFVDTSVGMTRVAHVKAIPPRNSQASQWQSTNTGVSDTLFQVLAGPGCVVDVVMEGAVTPNLRSTANNITIGGPASVGAIYYMALDNAFGSGTTSNLLIPSPDLVTIT